MSQLWFRADWLLEAISGRGSVSYNEIKKWAKYKSSLWTDENNQNVSRNPLEIQYRNRVLNIALKEIESLGHIDIFWGEKVQSKPISWYNECNNLNRWVLLGSRCKDFINYLKSSNSLIKEIDIVRRHIDFKDQTIRNIDKSNNLNLHIKLPSKISYEGKLPPHLEAINSNIIGNSRFPTSWKIVQSIPTNLLENIRQRIIDEGELTKVSLNYLRDQKWLDPKDNQFKVGPPPQTFDLNEVCLINNFHEIGYYNNYQAILKTDVSQEFGFTQYKKLEISKDEAAWLSYYLLFKNVRTLEFNPLKYELRHPSTLNLPLVVRRALIFCSGLPPRTEIINSKGYYISYTQISSTIALRVAELLNVELVINED